LKLREIAERLDCRLEGDGEVDIVRMAGLEQAGAGDLTFVANPKYFWQLAGTKASAVILHEKADVPAPCPVLRAVHPYLAFAKALGVLVPSAAPSKGIDPSTSIAPDARIGDDVSIGAFVVVGAGAVVGDRTVLYPNVVVGAGARLGSDCVLHSHVSVRERVQIGDRVILHDGVVLGSDGFGFVKQADGTHFKIPQRADVVIEDDVEIGANSTVDRPAVGETRIGAGTKIDNLVQVAHGVRVGRRALFAAQVGIAGSTTVEDDVVLAGQVGVTGHIRVGKGAVVTAQSGVPKDVPAGEVMSGYPAMPQRDWLKAAAIVRQLPTLKKRVAELEQRLAELEEKLAECRTPADR
jgi:UDP-3-O-[3-hydroxymyristoyl] glucosamine N-acyltransferase